ncbi:hypothetical protein C9374_008072 [Naegleria lovaniensis]|uniref:Uncharacterized protein n=1 Tax=Naegleria lovaniensis TaxID=51637 RepID=A0AA88KI23_NAELO|nr:uncharacterized protein C9374_008072 [Naegleria lovaniensis]KAG2378433.1 hypothetical protein C9374_008072 [Naegleria lovaniensis]
MLHLLLSLVVLLAIVGSCLILPFLTFIQYPKRNRFQLKQVQRDVSFSFRMLIQFRRIVLFIMDSLVHQIHARFTMRPTFKPEYGKHMNSSAQVEIVKPSVSDHRKFSLLSPFDVAFPPSFYCFFFEGYLDRDAFLRAMSKVLDVVPSLGGRVIQFHSLHEITTKAEEWFNGLEKLEKEVIKTRLHVGRKPVPVFDLRNVQLEVAFVDDDTIQTNETGLLSATELAKHLSILGSFMTIGPVKVVHSEASEPLTRFQVTYLRKSNKTALTLFMDHAVGDAASVSMVMKLLGDEMSSRNAQSQAEKKKELPIQNATSFFKYVYNREDEKIDDFAYSYYDPTACYSFFRAEVVKYLENMKKNNSKIISKEVTVTKRQLDQLKKRVTSENKELEGAKLTSNEILSAILLKSLAIGDKQNRFRNEKLLTLRYVATCRERCDFIASNYFGNAFGFIFNSRTKKQLSEAKISDIVLYLKQVALRTVDHHSYWEGKIEEMCQRYFDPLQVDFGFPAFEGNDNYMGITNWVKPMSSIAEHFSDKSFLGVSTLCMPFPHVNKILPASTMSTDGGLRLVLSLYEPEYLYFISEISK